VETCDTCVDQAREKCGMRGVGHLVKMSIISILLSLKKNKYCVWA